MAILSVVAASVLAVGDVSLAAAAATAPVNAGNVGAVAGVLTFEQHIRPILKAHCFDCHGEGDPLRGGLDLRLRRFMVRGGDSGTALVPGDPEASALYRLVKSGEMPKRDRKPTPEEVEVLRRWIEGGARTVRDEPETLPKGMQITAEEQAHWAFQPIRRPAVPWLPETVLKRVRTPVDAFVGAVLAERGLGFSPDAPRRSLARRLYFDLWGVPPTPQEVAEFEADPRADAYERLVDRLLASPRYGERWGRHWLDVVGYADSDGYTNDDIPRPLAYKYRDYVIAAFNADKPFDQFLIEQLAGDELALGRHATLEAAAQDPVSREWLVATGYLRMAADGTASGGIDQDAARNQVVADTLKIVSSSLLGLTVGCAQCHDHRYDPIPHTDYFRLRAVFEPAYDWKKWRKPGERVVSLYTAEERARAAEIEAEAVRLAAEREVKQQRYLDEALRRHLDEKVDVAVRELLWAAFKTPAAQRTEAQKRLLKDHPSANIHPGVLYQYDPKAADDLKAMDARIAAIRAGKPPEDFISVLSEPGGVPPVTYRFHRGDPGQPREPVGPGTLSVLPHDGPAPDLAVSEGGRTTGRRLAFARWVTGTSNPLTARVLVNRFWLHHLGRGLVGTPGDFGMQGDRPSHPELLDWLASVFVAPAGPGGGAGEEFGLGWSLKGFHRLVLLSTTYRQSSARERRGGLAARPEVAALPNVGREPGGERMARPEVGALPGLAGEPRGEETARPEVGLPNLAREPEGRTPARPEVAALPNLGREPGGERTARPEVGALPGLARDSRGQAEDPDNRWYWRMSLQRLDAESLRDSMLAASGVLVGRMFGGPVPVREDVVGQVVVGIDRKQGDNKMPVDVPLGEDEFRRSVYVEVRRSKPLAFLNTFDAPVMEVNCERRQVSTVAPQSLMLMNSEFALQQARLLAARVTRESAPGRESRIERAWWLAYGRAPNPAEVRQASRFLSEQEAILSGNDREREGDRDRGPEKVAGSPEERALRSLCQVLLGSNEFLYLD